MRGEVISLHIGQAGIQAGHSFWVQLLAEHGIAPDGVPFVPKCDPDEFADTLFAHSARDTYSPRAFCIDTDPGSLDWIRLSDYRDLYNPGQLITGLEDAGGCFARGYHHFGKHFTMDGKEKIRRALENCDKFQGFMIFRSLTGGTGSGLSSILMQRVNDDFVKKSTLTLDILPTPQGGSTLDPYNVVLALHETMDISDVSFLFSNKSLFRIAEHQMGVKRPHFRHVNQIVATVASHVTNGLRFKSDLGMTLAELETNLVPLPRLKYPVLSYSPFCAPGRSVTDTVISTLVNNLFTRDAQLVPCDTYNGRYISALLLLRGNFQPDEVNQYIHRLTNHANTPAKFVDWIPPSVKYAMCTRPPMKPYGTDLGHVPRAAVGAMNHSGMEPVLRPYINSFRKMFCNKAFLHLYKQEGMEEQDFQDALQDMLALQEDFKSVSQDEKPSTREKQCVEISVPKSAILSQRQNTGRCGPCRRLNVELDELRVRECDKGCGPIPIIPWRCTPCLGRNKIEDMTIIGKGIGRKVRPPCVLPKEENDQSNAVQEIMKKGGCGLIVKQIC